MKNVIIKGDCIEELKNLNDESVDLIFADPPYWMQTEGELLRTEGTIFKGVDDEWDKFRSYNEYDEFSFNWIKECKRVLKPNGSFWVIGAFQNIYRIGFILQELDMWIINDIIWNKSNPTPNFKGTRFTNASETLIWVTKSKNSKYTFNYKTMKFLNGGKQMKSVWNIPLCTGNERLKDREGLKLHNTQKPLALLKNVILSSSKENDLVLDPFLGSGTTAAVAKEYGRNYIGIEREDKYIDYIEKRLKNVKRNKDEDLIKNTFDIKPIRVPIINLINVGYLKVNEKLYDKNEKFCGYLLKNGKISIDGVEYSIHKGSAHILNLTNNNGWDFFYVKRDKITSINSLRETYRTIYHEKS